MIWSRRLPTPAIALAASALAVLAIGGCGGSSTVKPAAYVRSVCQALSTWRNTVQSAGAALQSSGASTATRPVAKEDYQRFVGSLVTATRRATHSLKTAGTPSIADGRRIAQRLTGAFGRATRGLSRASAHASLIRTDTASNFQLGASAVSAEIKSALDQIAGVAPGQNQALRAAATKQPACQLLASG